MRAAIRRFDQTLTMLTEIPTAEATTIHGFTAAEADALQRAVRDASEQV